VMAATAASSSTVWAATRTLTRALYCCNDANMNVTALVKVADRAPHES
jgi:hypothetical protein